MDYPALCANIARITENSFETTDLNLFISLTEKNIYSSCQLANLRKNAAVALTSGDQYLAAPDDFLSAYSIAVISADGTYTFLLDKDVNFIREAYPKVSSTGLPKHYAIFGPQVGALTKLRFILGPTPDAAYAAELNYFYYPESIVTATNTWLGDNFEMALLNGCLVEAARFMKAEADIVALYQQMYTQSIALLKNLGDGKQRGDAYRDGQTRVKVS